MILWRGGGGGESTPVTPDTSCDYAVIDSLPPPSSLLQFSYPVVSIQAKTEGCIMSFLTDGFNILFFNHFIILVPSFVFFCFLNFVL